MDVLWDFLQVGLSFDRSLQEDHCFPHQHPTLTHFAYLKNFLLTLDLPLNPKLTLVAPTFQHSAPAHHPSDAGPSHFAKLIGTVMAVTWMA